MGTPAKHLPKNISNNTIDALLESIGLPKAMSISSTTVTAEYHSIFMIALPPNEKAPQELVLRISGHHLPRIKTENEIGVMSWLASNTTIPIPDVVAYDSSTDNPLAHEYTLLSRSSGETLSDVQLNDDQLRNVLHQLLDILLQLHAHKFDAIGGLVRTSQGQVEVGTIVDETFWQVPDVQQFWPASETVASLNLGGPYRSYVELVSAQVQVYMHLIRVHENLVFMHDTLDQLEAFQAALVQHADELNQVQLRLAHKDLHFANVLYDVASGKITSVLDWEFAGVVPFPKWNPRRAFLWNGREDGAAEKQRLFELFGQICKQRGVALLDDASYSSNRQESMQKVADFLRAITEVAPREKDRNLEGWKAVVVENISRVVATDIPIKTGS